MSLFSIPELREEARRSRQGTTIAVSHSNLGPGDATFHLDKWALELIQYARQQGFNVVDIGGSDLTYDRMTEILLATKPAVLFNFSHGCRAYLMGNDLRCTLTRGWEDEMSCGTCGKPSNLSAIRGMAVVAYSCHSGYQLGKCAVNYGCPAYAGFSDSLIVVSDAYRMQDIFKEALMPMSQHILEGWTIGAAVEQTKIDLLNTVKQYKVIELVSVPIWYNRKYLTLHGDPNWKII